MNLQEWFLKLAQIEEDGAELYRKFSEDCNEKLKSVVISFSEEELKHKELMLELSGDENLKKKRLDEEVELTFKKQINHLENNGNKLDSTSEKDFFQFALQLEKNSIEIYTKQLSSFEKDSDAYKKFESIIKEERKHMLFILNKLYELK